MKKLARGENDRAVCIRLRGDTYEQLRLLAFQRNTSLVCLINEFLAEHLRETMGTDIRRAEQL